MSNYLPLNQPARLVDQQMKMTIPLGGALGDPTRDLGPALVFLAGDGAGFITGQLIAVDGGLTMPGGWWRILFLLLVADRSGCDVDAQPVLWKSTIRR